MSISMSEIYHYTHWLVDRTSSRSWHSYNDGWRLCKSFSRSVRLSEHSEMSARIYARILQHHKVFGKATWGFKLSPMFARVPRYHEVLRRSCENFEFPLCSWGSKLLPMSIKNEQKSMAWCVNVSSKPKTSLSDAKATLCLSYHKRSLMETKHVGIR